MGKVDFRTVKTKNLRSPRDRAPLIQNWSAVLINFKLCISHHVGVFGGVINSLRSKNVCYGTFDPARDEGNVCDI